MTLSPSASLLRRAWAFLGSRVASFWILGAWLALTIVWVLPFQLTGQPAATVTAIAEHWLVFRLVYALVAIATLKCVWGRLARDVRRMRMPQSAPSAPSEDSVLLTGYGVHAIRQSLESRGYSVSDDGSVLHATKHRYSVLGGSVFHIGVVLLGFSLVAHGLTVDSRTLRITEGQEVTEAAESAKFGRLPSALRYLRLESIEPGYFKDVLLFTKLDAAFKAADGSSRRLSLSRPLWLSPVSLLSISDYNLAPHIEVTDANNQTTEYVVAMSLVPPGNRDEATVPETPLTISMMVYPDHAVINGRDVSRSYNIVKPAFMVSVLEQGRQGALLARQLVRIGEPIKAAEYSVRISGLSRYGTFRVISAPALPFVALSLLAMCVGVCWRYVLRRRSVMAWVAEDGTLIDAWVDLRGRAAAREEIVRELRRAGRSR